MRIFQIKHWRLFLIGALALCIVGCNTVRQPATTTPETEALLRAARGGNADTVKTLLASSNVDVNGVDADGNTALIEAARFGHDERRRRVAYRPRGRQLKKQSGQDGIAVGV